jgi:uncharacterized membrane protein YraQ (UPF0718 family)
MKKYNKYLPIILFLIFVAISAAVNFAPGKTITMNFGSYLLEMLTILPFLFIIVGLLDSWVPKEVVEKHIGKDSGVKGIVFAVLLAMIQAGPLYGAFPITYVLYKKGASPRNIFIYLGAFSSLKLPMLGMELNYLGPKFTIVHTVISLPLFIIGGFIMEFLLRGQKFEVKDVRKEG